MIYFFIWCYFLWDYFFNWDIFLVELFYRRCLWPGLLRARFARFLLRKETSPSYPYRDFFVLGVNLVFWWFIFLFGVIFCGIIFLIEIFFWWNYFIGDAFGPGYSGLASLGFCFAMNQTLRIPIAIILCWSFMWVMPLLLKLLGRVPTGRASTDNATL